MNNHDDVLVKIRRKARMKNLLTVLIAAVLLAAITVTLAYAKPFTITLPDKIEVGFLSEAVTLERGHADYREVVKELRAAVNSKPFVNRGI